MKRTRHGHALSLAALLAGCVGQIPAETDSPAEEPPGGPAPRPGASRPGEPGAPAPGAPGGPAPGAPAPGPGAPSAAVCKPGKEASPRRVWRLTEAQYAATVKWILPAGAAQPTNPFRGLKSQERFSTGSSDVGMPELAVEQLFAASESVAATLIRGLKTALPCLGAAAPDLACYREVVTRVGPRAVRRLLAADEVTRHANAMLEARATTGAQLALELGVEALLARPEAVFRMELGGGTPDAAGRVRMTPFELASALSYSITNGPPDDALWAAAESGKLATSDEVRAQAVRLWTTAGAAPRGVIEQFFREYFRYDLLVPKDAKLHPYHNAESLAKDTTLFVQDLFFEQRKDFIRNLFTSGAGFADAATAGSYGLAGLPMGTKQKVTFPAGQRSGILTHPGFLAPWSGAAENHPVQRGVFIREDVLCQEVPPLPIDMIPPLPDLGPNTTVRERLAMHSKGTCVGCHRLMDPLGLPFEQYDHTGRFRTMEAGKPVDTTGVIAGLGDRDIPVSGPAELARVLAGAPEVRGCFSRRALQFLLGRPDLPSDGCAVAAMEAALARDGDAIDAFAALMSSESVMYRFAK